MTQDFDTGAARPAISPNALILVAAWLASGAFLAVAPSEFAARLATFVFVILGWILAVMVHEFGHAFIAHKAGDHTIRAKGYLTLDPLKYVDVGVSIVIPILAVVLGGIGFPGGAVYLREDLMRSRWWRSLASLAGPLGTLLVMIVLIALIWVVALTLTTPNARMLCDALAFLAFLQATAFVLNLLPVPGLDGYGVIRPFLPDAVRAPLRKVEGFAMVGLFLLIFLLPGASAIIFAPALMLTDIAGLPRELIQAGWEAFRFWQS
ncbi:peptidase M50 [Phenylobacterium sp. Root77]|jgi:Zn-dependent protease|uniref:site-2 protease family protein n=1 Tax=unclassified Phenylobacterium TaxID=2640670 RepID=UPI000700A6E9|nr:MULTISPECIES: site-2 protease family protein [unclassified Phenylobacterium]KQW70884.1 peptidase M50 [Phenylobacterium sp. Root1277]KQW90695.1 peptidase M50 [Phenylobacterium sp. Root1290]KRC39673.1 peptidase M50 [Phenylobacterium sp. Root77]